MKKSFVMYKSWKPIFDALDDHSAAQLIRAIFAAQNGERVTIEDPALNGYMALFLEKFKEDQESYFAVVDRNRENGKKGGRPRKRPP